MVEFKVASLDLKITNHSMYTNDNLVSFILTKRSNSEEICDGV